MGQFLAPGGSIVAATGISLSVPALALNGNAALSDP